MLVAERNIHCTRRAAGTYQSLIRLESRRVHLEPHVASPALAVVPANSCLDIKYDTITDMPNTLPGMPFHSSHLLQNRIPR